MKIIEIKEEVRIGDVILEAGDQIVIINEAVSGSVKNLFVMLDRASKDLNSSVIVSLLKSTMTDYTNEKVIQRFAQDLNDNIGEELSYL